MGKQIRFCPRCEWTKEMMEKELLKLEQYIEHIPEEDRVSDEEYERRLLRQLPGTAGRLMWAVRLLRRGPRREKGRILPAYQGEVVKISD